jgi:hypothetical protein
MRNFLRAVALTSAFGVYALAITLGGLALFLFLATDLFAQSPNTVTWAWGDFVGSLFGGLQQALALALLAAATAVIGLLPSWVQDIVRPLVLTWRTNQLFEKLAATVIGGTRGATAGKTVEITIANDMVRQIVQLALERGAPKVLEFAGSNIQSLAEKALARLQEKGVIPADYTLAHAVDAARQGAGDAS